MNAVAAMSNLPLQAPRQLWAGFRSSPVDKVPAKPLWKNTVLVNNSKGKQESFSIGSDGFIWSYDTGNAIKRAGRLVSTGLQGTSFAVGMAGNGVLVVVATDGLALRYTVESDDAKATGARWTAPRIAALTTGLDALCLEKVFTKTEDGNLFVGVTACYTDAKGQLLRQFWHGVWAGKELICGHHPMGHHYVNEFWFETFCANGHLGDLVA